MVSSINKTGKLSLLIILLLKWKAAEFLKKSGRVMEFKVEESPKSLQESDIIPVG